MCIEISLLKSFPPLFRLSRSLSFFACFPVQITLSGMNWRYGYSWRRHFSRERIYRLLDSYKSALNPRSRLLSNPRYSATNPKWSTPQNPSVSPLELVQTNQGTPKARASYALSTLAAKAALTLGSEIYTRKRKGIGK